MSDQINLAIYKKGGKTFQIDVDPDLAMDFKEGKDVEIREVLKVQDIFSDAKKGNLAKGTDLVEFFGTEDVLEVAGKIIKEGEVQVSAQYRNKIKDNKRKQLIDIIHRNAVDPSNHLPHPVTRLEAAFEEAKVRVDEKKTAQEQLDDVMKQLRPIIPLKFEIKKIEIKIPSELAGKAYGKVINLGNKLNEKWLDDGSLLVVLEIPAGIESEVYDEVNSLTQGKAEMKVIESR